MATSITITPAQAPELILDVMKAGHVPMVISSPGVGKSSIAKQIAKEQNLKLIDLRLSQCDPADLNGFPSIDKETGKASYVPMDMFPVAGDKLPKHLDANGAPKKDDFDPDGNDRNSYAGWFLLLDEFNSAAPSVQAAAYKVVLDKQVGMHDLHPRVVIMGAGNKATDRAIVNPLSTAMQSRLIHFELSLSNPDWQHWAVKNDIDFRVTAYLNFKEGDLQAFDPTHSDKTFACPRTWEFLSDIIKPFKRIDKKKMPLIHGTIGEGVGAQFYAFCAIFDKLPTLQQILASPETVPLSKDASILYAITGLVSANFNKKTALQLIPFIDRLPIEFQVILLRGAVKKDESLADEPAIEKWVISKAQHLV